MNNYSEIIKKTEEFFSSQKLPDYIFIDDCGRNGDFKSEYDDMENDYTSTPAADFDYNTCAMLITDSALINDEAMFCFLPRLIKAVFEEGANEFLLLLRLEKIVVEDDEDLKNLLDEIKSSLKKLDGYREGLDSKK